MVGEGIRKQVKEIHKHGPGRVRDTSENTGCVSLGLVANKDPQESPDLFIASCGYEGNKTQLPIQRRK